ncbi:SpoIIE family protein phosphatase [Pseudoxanthomonas koreensis]|uniref:SpoIIE family protein phosphatase n=1 Tax=Pseudoxanthomonas koreensis TaxID=266061 RepID=UPI001390D897|nr:SpoIIE family protein phosphatase [Pseudoxanthomonas koreensis]KAF1694925.1 IcfG protein [Pseudoxanthomonas koreensis]
MPIEASDATGAAPPHESVRWYHSLRTRIALWSGLSTLLFLLAVTLATAAYLRREILDNAQRDNRATAGEAAERLETSLRTLTVATGNLAQLVSRASLDHEQLRQAQAAVLDSIPGAAGTLLIVEPREPGGLAYTRYMGPLGERDFLADGYDYHAQPWYRATQAAPAGWWSEPYLNQTAGQVWMATYNVPLRPLGTGMASLDIPVDDLIAPIETLAHLPGMRVTLLAPGGTIALSTIPGARAQETFDAFIARQDRGDLAEVAAAARERRQAYLGHRDANIGRMRYTSVEPVGDTGWTLLVGQSYDLIMDRFDRALLALVLVSLVLAAAGTFLVRRIGRQISKPLEALAGSAVDAIVDGREVPLAQQQRRDEVGVLARTLERARHSIRGQLGEIEQLGAARQKLESELSIARDIQQAMLPQGRTLGQGSEHLEAQALLEPAKAVGGDFYNFIEREDGELWFVVGDVSDKGVPAALFMARAVTVLEVAIQTATSPSQALAEGSRRLVQGNDTCMFATVLCGRIDLHGNLALASAGHDPPLLLHGDGRVQPLAVESGPPLGFELSSDFPSWQGALAAGDCLVAYTDGVTEAFNLADEAYGDERLRQALARHGGTGAAATCAQVLADVRRFVDGAPPSDDTTILAISHTRDLDIDTTQAHAVGAKGETSVHVSVAQSSADVLRMTDAIEALLACHGASQTSMHDARLIVEEVACNAVEHAVTPGAPLEMHARVADGQLWLEFRDRGPAFDPTTRDAPDLDTDIAERDIGGLGVFLVRELADAIDYQRIDGSNILRISLRLDAANDMESKA